jgi:hypothetical protein
VGFTLDDRTIRALAATVASEVVNALRNAQLVAKSSEAATTGNGSQLLTQ